MAKRFTKPSIVWAEIEKRVPPDQKTNFMAFKGKSDAYLRRVLSNPPEPPKIDWESYKKTVPIPGLVEKFQSSYESLKIPFPEDKLSAEIDAQWGKVQAEIKDFNAKADALIQEATKELSKIKALPKFDDMTMEMFYDMYPGIALDPVNRPTFWPHTPEEQPGYVSPEAKAAEEAGGH